MERPVAILPVVRLLLSLLIAAHLGVVALRLLAAPSGPWPVEGSSSLASPPQFATQFVPETGAARRYLHVLHLDGDFRLPSNRPQTLYTLALRATAEPTEDADETVARLPDPDARVAVQQRQWMLADQLGADVRVMPPPGEEIAGVGRSARKAEIWQFRETPEGRLMVVDNVPEHLIPRDRPSFGPSRKARLLAGSYARFLLERAGTPTLGIQRVSHRPIPPDVLYLDEPPPDSAFDPTVATFGEFTADE